MRSIWLHYVYTHRTICAHRLTGLGQHPFKVQIRVRVPLGVPYAGLAEWYRRQVQTLLRRLVRVQVPCPAPEKRENLKSQYYVLRLIWRNRFAIISRKALLTTINAEVLEWQTRKSQKLLRKRVWVQVPSSVPNNGIVVQQSRTLACHARGREFESRRCRHMGCGTARGGHLFCTQDNRRVRIPCDPPLNIRVGRA